MGQQGLSVIRSWWVAQKEGKQEGAGPKTEEVGGREVGTWRGQGLERLGGHPEPYLGHKEHDQGDI